MPREKHTMRQKHGQNFLIDNNIANNIVKAANLNENDNVIEIGPGKGILTKIIQPLAGHLTAVEIDENLFRPLKYYFTSSNAQNINLINKDFMKFDLASYVYKAGGGDFDAQNGKKKEEILKNEFESRNNFTESRAENAEERLFTRPKEKILDFSIPFKVISNLPYNAGTAIVQKILPLPNWTQCVFMLQKEVAQRLAAKTGTKDYGYISVFTQYYADAELLFDVSAKCFNPHPKVMSSVVRLSNKKSAPPDPLFFELVKKSFSMRRKTILNCLASFKNLEKSQANKILINCALDPFLRPDRLSLSDYLRLTDKIKNYIILQS